MLSRWSEAMMMGGSVRAGLVPEQQFGWDGSSSGPMSGTLFAGFVGKGLMAVWFSMRTSASAFQLRFFFSFPFERREAKGCTKRGVGVTPPFFRDEKKENSKH